MNELKIQGTPLKPLSSYEKEVFSSQGRKSTFHKQEWKCRSVTGPFTKPNAMEHTHFRLPQNRQKISPYTEIIWQDMLKGMSLSTSTK